MRILSFSTRLFLSIIALFWGFVGCFIYYQYLREKDYRVELLTTRLSDFNLMLHSHLEWGDSSYSLLVRGFETKPEWEDIRVTLIRSNGEVIYDNNAQSVAGMGNHLNREEVQEALLKREGYALKRTSATLGQPYFYAATHFPAEGLIVRTALPYDLNLYASLKADLRFIWVTLLVTTLLSLAFYSLTTRLGATITRLRQIARKADEGSALEPAMESTGDGELDQIANHIIEIYNHLSTTKDDLFLAHEKLIAHLQISNEGLAIFNARRGVILSNALFMQYANLISDRNLTNMEEVFTLPAFSPLTDFVNEVREHYNTDAETRKQIIIESSGYIFMATAVVFYDKSFELSIFDVTRQEEQARLKRQITQNMAHELKTPVSSIQGYLETILDNPDMEPDVKAQFLTRCYAQSNRLTNLLRDIAALTRLDEAPGLIEVSQVDVRKVVETICDELALALRERQMEVTCLLPDEMVLTGNETLIYSIFRNLMDNAIAYAGEGTRVQVNCFFDDEECYYFSVKDNGIGVPLEHLNRLFERFYRIDKGRSRKIGGTGLGLAIVKNAVAFHGGTIHAKQANDRGVEFVFNLKKRR